MSLPRLVYISGAISQGDQFRNVQLGIDAFNDLMNAGIPAYCAHFTVFAQMTVPRSHDEWMRYDLDVILPRCSAVYRIPGKSVGADMEEQRANELGIPVFKTMGGGAVVVEGVTRGSVSGGTVTFETGAVRSADRVGQRYDLISPVGLRRLAETCHEGAAKYSDFNWERGMAVSEMLNHAISHIYSYASGDRSEDHLAHAAWNLFGAMHSEEMWPELNKNLRRAGCKPPEETTVVVSPPLGWVMSRNVMITEGAPELLVSER